VLCNRYDLANREFKMARRQGATMGACPSRTYDRAQRRRRAIFTSTYGPQFFRRISARLLGSIAKDTRPFARFLKFAKLFAAMASHTGLHNTERCP